jgi:cytochrome c-type biogenesis protein CcmH/NrfG
MGRIDSERALEALERRVRESPEAGEAWGALGDLQRELGHREAAHAAYDRARALNSTNLVYEIRYRQTGG